MYSFFVDSNFHNINFSIFQFPIEFGFLRQNCKYNSIFTKVKLVDQIRKKNGVTSIDSNMFIQGVVC